MGYDRLFDDLTLGETEAEAMTNVKSSDGRREMKISANLKKIRTERRLTMKEVAIAAGVSVSTYRDWEYGRKIPAEALPYLASALNVQLGDLYGTPQPNGEQKREAVNLLEEAIRILRTLS